MQRLKAIVKHEVGHGSIFIEEEVVLYSDHLAEIEELKADLELRVKELEADLAASQEEISLWKATAEHEADGLESWKKEYEASQERVRELLLYSIKYIARKALERGKG